MESSKLDDLIKKIKSGKEPVALFGAGTLGKLALCALNRLGVQVDFFCDSDRQKQGKLYCGIKTISPEELAGLAKDTRVFIANDYIAAVRRELERMKFRNIHDCAALLESADFNNAKLDLPALNIKRQIAKYLSSCRQAEKDIKFFDLKYVDVIITERCSLRCKDCSNLMQYYAHPQNCDLALLLASLDKLLKSVDYVNELRIIGGEPFMNKDLNKIIYELIKYKNVGAVVIYTNGTIAPAGENLLCLKNSKVALDITNYGPLSRSFEKLVKILKENGITYVVNDMTSACWTDCAKVKYQARSQKEITKMFMNCCVNDVLSLLHGKLYHCPFSAHATNLRAIPFFKEDVIDLTALRPDSELRKKIINFYQDKDFLSACLYCQGRTYEGELIKPAIQADKPLDFLPAI